MGIRDFVRRAWKVGALRLSNMTKRDEAEPDNTWPGAAEALYWRAVQAANQSMADQIAGGVAPPMASGHYEWFVEHAGQAVNPTEALGVTWYAHQDVGRMQLVSHETLVATGMDVPANQPGVKGWGQATGSMS